MPRHGPAYARQKHKVSGRLGSILFPWDRVALDCWRILFRSAPSRRVSSGQRYCCSPALTELPSRHWAGDAIVSRSMRLTYYYTDTSPTDPSRDDCRTICVEPLSSLTEPGASCSETHDYLQALLQTSKSARGTGRLTKLQPWNGNASSRKDPGDIPTPSATSTVALTCLHHFLTRSAGRQRHLAASLEAFFLGTSSTAGHLAGKRLILSATLSVNGRFHGWSAAIMMPISSSS